jgi:hypothetical protein
MSIKMIYFVLFEAEWNLLNCLDIGGQGHANKLFPFFQQTLFKNLYTQQKNHFLLKYIYFLFMFWYIVYA